MGLGEKSNLHICDKLKKKYFRAKEKTKERLGDDKKCNLRKCASTSIILGVAIIFNMKSLHFSTQKDFNADSHNYPIQ